MFVRSLLPFSLTLSVSTCAGATFTECLDVCRSDFSKFVFCIFHHDILSMCFDMCWFVFQSGFNPEDSNFMCTSWKRPVRVLLALSFHLTRTYRWNVPSQLKSSQVDTWCVIHRFSDRGSTHFVSCHRVKNETSLVRIRDSDL